MSARIGPEHYGAEPSDTEVAKAERIVAEQLHRRKWTVAELSTRPKGDPAKVTLAARLRAETTMTAAWIAELLAMGTRGHLNRLLYRHRQLHRR